MHAGESTIKMNPLSAPNTIQAGFTRAKTAHVHAWLQWLPRESTAVRLSTGVRVWNTHSLFACGAIFGTIVGFLLQKGTQPGDYATIVNWVVCTLFGITLFYTSVLLPKRSHHLPRNSIIYRYYRIIATHIKG
jgi:hypothetical protein